MCGRGQAPSAAYAGQSFCFYYKVLIGHTHGWGHTQRALRLDLLTRPLELKSGLLTTFRRLHGQEPMCGYCFLFP